MHLAEISRPQPGPGEVQVNIRHVGVCGTDRELIRYLKVPWLDDGEFRQLAKNLGLKVPRPRKRKKR